MRILRFLAAGALALCTAAPTLAAPATLTWYQADSLAWTTPLNPAAEGPSRPVDADPWLPRLPEARISLLEGGEFDTAAELPPALILDFWATWCAPCVKELPLLHEVERLYRDRGVRLIAVNAQEDDETIRVFLERVGLSLEIGRYSKELDRVLQVRNLPTLMLIDSEGQIRRRWNGYREGLEVELGQAIGNVLADKDPDVRPVRVADVRRGRVEAHWTRTGRLPVQDLGPADGQAGAPPFTVLRGSSMAMVEGDGVVRGRFRAPSGMSGLRALDLDGDGTRELIGHRPGSDRVTVFSPSRGAFSEWQAPRSAFDIASLHPSGGQPGELLLATSAGLMASDMAGNRLRALVEGSGFRSLLVTGPADDPTIWTLSLDGALQAFDRVGKARREPLAGDRSGWLVQHPGLSGFGVASAGIRSVAGLRVEGRDLLLVLLEQGTVLGLNPETGSEELRIDWPGAKAVVAADFDGDGSDELVVADGSRITLVSATPAASAEGREATASAATSAPSTGGQ
ncbi:hypothetical protein ABI59_19595 [Acidobacteria bacterium Mor1]|nr:hypothetical protein ABI59_19595 [Acidobacteria bacterium Mor1]